MPGAQRLHGLCRVHHSGMGCHVAYGDRKSERIEFERGIDVYIMGIDGTWRRDGKLNDVSRTGARLTVTGSIQGLDLKEFFLLLSSTGLAYRRCRMVRLCRRSNRRRVLEAHDGKIKESSDREVSPKA